FIDLDRNKANYLRAQCAGHSNVSIVHDNANVYLRKLLPTTRFGQRERPLCVLDPYELNLDWDVIELAGKSGVVDLFLNFPVMDMNRSAIWREPERAPADGIERMNRFRGDESWRQAAYAKSPQSELFSGPQDEKQTADSDDAGHAFQQEAGHRFRFEASRDSDLMSATWHLLPRIDGMMFCSERLVKRAWIWISAKARVAVDNGGRRALSIAP
ncbi:MAG TPA: three-Cys-motif partner protein TcmP, partial [Roseiarcus sp.]|nr:three-Cys-motif partner protein TcmP [Roseiarcus sp.]